MHVVFFGPMRVKVMSFIGPVFRRCMRRANLIRFAGGLFVLCGMSAVSHAGVIFPQAEPAVAIEPVSAATLTELQSGAGSLADSRHDHKRQNEPEGLRLKVGELLGDSARGASSPAPGGGGSTNLTMAASMTLPADFQAINSIFAHWREMSLRIPCPAAERLLDPPKLWA